MASETKALEELLEVIFATLVVVVLGFFFALSYNPNLLFSEIQTTEIAAISSILPQNTVVSIVFDTESKLENLENNKFIISVDEEFIEEEAKNIPLGVLLKQENNNIIISKN